MFDVKLYLDESLLAEIEYQKFVVQNSIKVSSQMVDKGFNAMKRS